MAVRAEMSMCCHVLPCTMRAETPRIGNALRDRYLQWNAQHAFGVVCGERATLPMHGWTCPAFFPGKAFISGICPVRSSAPSDARPEWRPLSVGLVTSKARRRRLYVSRSDCCMV